MSGQGFQKIPISKNKLVVVFLTYLDYALPTVIISALGQRKYFLKNLYQKSWAS